MKELSLIHIYPAHLLPHIFLKSTALFLQSHLCFPQYSSLGFYLTLRFPALTFLRFRPDLSFYSKFNCRFCQVFRCHFPAKLSAAGSGTVILQQQESGERHKHSPLSPFPQFYFAITLTNFFFPRFTTTPSPSRLSFAKTAFTSFTALPSTDTPPCSTLRLASEREPARPDL